METYTEYKDSGVAWIGEIPARWEVKKLRSHFKERKVKVSDTDFPPLSVAKIGVVPQLEDACKTDNGDNRKLVRKGDFVVNSRSDRKGSCGVSSLDGSVSLINIVLEPRGINAGLVHLLLRSHNYVEEFYRNGRGIVADLWTTRYSEMKNIFIPVPPLEEQQQISSYIDSQLAKIQSYERERERELSLLETLKKTEIAQVVTKGLNPDAPMKDSGIPWIGEIPAHWEVKSLSQLARERSVSNKEVHHQNLLSLSYGRIIQKDINRTEGLLPASYDTYQIVENGNIVLRLTDLQNDHKSLRVGLVTQTGIITSAYVALAPYKHVMPTYLYSSLHAIDIKKVFYSMGGGLRQNLSWGELRKLRIQFPPIEEQQAIVDYIESRTQKIDSYIAAITEELEQLRQYKQRLISDAVTGKIKVSTPIKRQQP